MKTCFVLLAFCLFLPIPTSGDLGPMTYKGYCLAPCFDQQIRMARETVDIYIGDRYSDDRHIRRVCVEARFYMQNGGPDTVVIDVGFPAEAEWFDMDATKPVSQRIARPLETNAEYGIYDFSVSVDGGAFFQPMPTIVNAAFDSWIPHEHIWYGWNMVFPPGETIVDVEYHVKTNHGYASINQEVRYVLGTGRFWRDDIGEAVVRVHLPPDYKEVWLSSVWPRKYDRDDETLTWHWTDYEPEFSDCVVVGFMPPEVLSELRSLERLEKDDSDNVDVLMELARQYFYAAYRKGLPRSSYPDFAKLAEVRLDRLLEIDPTNCEAWLFYIRNYHRVRWDSFGLPWNSYIGIRDKHRSIIERAFENCPDDEEIQLWHALLHEDPWEPPEEIGYEVLYRNGEPWRIKLNDFKQNRGTGLRKHEEKIMDRYYKRTESVSGVPFFALKSKDLSESDKRRIMSVLEKRGFFRHENADPLLLFYGYR